MGEVALVTDIELVEKQAVYAGQRSAKGGKVVHAWIIDGDELWFSKPTGQVVGGIYVLKMTEDLKQVSTGAPKYAMERIKDNSQVAAWEARHRIVVRDRKRASAERRHKANDVLKDATWSLDRIVKGMRNVDDVYALSDVLKEHLLKTYWDSRG